MSKKSNTENKLVGFCLNSRKYIDFMMILPKSCPQGWQGNTFCQDEACGYYTLREQSHWYKEKMEIMQAYSDD